MKLFIFTLLFSLSLLGCRDYGTEGGNPQNPVSGVISAKELAETLCAKRASCLGQADSGCLGILSTQPEITNELRINPPYRTLQELATGLLRGEVLVETLALAACGDAIKNLNCSDPDVQQIFDPLSYDDIHLAFRASASCTDVYKVK